MKIEKRKMQIGGSSQSLMCVVTVLLLLSFVTAGANVSGGRQSSVGAPASDETPAQRDARMKWWREARFGMFIHWGVYSVPAGIYNGKHIGGIGEWIMNT